MSCGFDFASVASLGGLAGGPARARKLSAARRSEIARKAAEARWGDPLMRALKEVCADMDRRPLWQRALK